MSTTTLATRLVSNITKLDSSARSWRQYVRDHRSVILNSSTKIELRPEMMHIKRYRMNELLNELSYPEDIVWIVMWLNQLKGHADIVDLSRLILPDVAVLKDLYAQYESFIKKVQAI